MVIQFREYTRRQDQRRKITTLSDIVMKLLCGLKSLCKLRSSARSV